MSQLSRPPSHLCYGPECWVVFVMGHVVKPWVWPQAGVGVGGRAVWQRGSGPFRPHCVPVREHRSAFPSVVSSWAVINACHEKRTGWAFKGRDDTQCRKNQESPLFSGSFNSQPTKHVQVTLKKRWIKKKKAFLQSCIEFSSCFILFFLHRVKFPRIISSHSLHSCLSFTAWPSAVSPGLWPPLLRHQRTPLSPCPRQALLAFYLLGSWEPLSWVFAPCYFAGSSFSSSCPVPKMLVNLGFFCCCC